MTGWIERYFSFEGRLPRLPFFIRNVYVSIAAAVLIIASIPLFSQGSRVLWWAGIVFLAIAMTASAVSLVSLMVRRLHDLGLSGYHAIWVGVAQVFSTALSYGSDLAVLASLPLALIGLWLTFWPGQKTDNRFGPA
jgi:uncharacterized membrane protein YhaH (DUF805 family)